MPALAQFDLDRMLSLDEAAAFLRLSRDTLRRHYPQFLCRLSPRRVGMRLRNALLIGGGGNNDAAA
jgi:hypothetical protein